MFYLSRSSLTLCSIFGRIRASGLDAAYIETSQLPLRSALTAAALLGALLGSLASNSVAICREPGETSQSAQRTELDLASPAEGQPPRPATNRSDAGIASSTWEEPLQQELSIEPGTLPLMPQDAPAWIGAAPELNDDVHRLFVGGLIADNPADAAELLDAPLVEAVNQYIDHTVLQRTGASSELVKKVTADYIWKNLIDERAGYLAELTTSGQSMYQKWVIVSITPQQRMEIERWERLAQQQERLAVVGLGLAGLLGCVGLLHVLLSGFRSQNKRPLDNRQLPNAGALR